MDRRAFIGTLTGGLLAAPLVAEAQQAGKVYRIGFITLASLSDPRIEAFRKGMRELGYIEGKTIAIDWRSADGSAERLPALAERMRIGNITALRRRAPPAWPPSS